MTETQTSPAINALYRESVEAHLEVYRAGAAATRARAKALQVDNADQGMINEAYRQMHEWEAQVRAVESIVGYVSESLDERNADQRLPPSRDDLVRADEHADRVWLLRA